jgi:hypothetical protein
MIFLIDTSESRPDMLEGSKDEKYHLSMARYAVGQANTQKHLEFVSNIERNRRFYAGDQWYLQEDTETFFKDENNQERNRIKVINNTIRPMVENYRGNAIRMQINANAKSISPLAISRRQKILSKMLFFTDIANEEGNPFKQDLQKRLPIGNSQSETEDTFNNLYTDRYVETINDLLSFVSDKNKFQSRQVRAAEDLALCGLAVMKDFESGGHQYFDLVPPEHFIWDRSCKESDLSDSEFMGELKYMTLSDINEEAPNLTADERKSIQAYIASGSNTNANGSTLEAGVETKYTYGGRCPVFYMVWKDTEKHEYGYVKDPFGYPYFTRINHKEDWEDAPKYTDKDLIEVDSVRSRRLLKGKLKASVYTDVIRYCNFIPREVLLSPTNADKEKIHDVILEWGLLPYQETENLDVSNVNYPYKCCTWAYVDGQVLSPVDDAISPQRMINRVLSVAENQINNSRGSGTFYDKSMVDPQDGEAEMLRNMNQSKPVGINAKGRGIQNAVSQYDTTVKNGTMTLFNIVSLMSDYTQKMTGINEAIKGESTGSDQLVGVTQLMIQRGSLMQEPFYNAITSLYLQCYQSIASRGVKIYADNERELTIAVGDVGAKIVNITKDMKLEDFRVFVKRDNPDDVLVQSGNQMLTFLLQMQLINNEDFALMYGRFTPDMITASLRKKALENKELGKMQAQQEQQQSEAAMMEAQKAQAQQEMMYNEAVARDDIKDLQNKKHEERLQAMKNLGSIAKNSPMAQRKILEDSKNL